METEGETNGVSVNITANGYTSGPKNPFNSRRVFQKSSALGRSTPSCRRMCPLASGALQVLLAHCHWRCGNLRG
jgi:hypothetical protein